MNPAEAYIPIDRRQALANGATLPTESHGATLFVDISGFTPLTGALLQRYGPRRGAEELTRQLNRVYTALITEVERYCGSIIGFSGDAITCWFDGQRRDVGGATSRAIGAALAIQQSMAQFHTIRLDGRTTISLAVKTAIAAGGVRRFTVGDPAIQLIDVLAGSTLDRMAAAEQMAAQNELVVDEVSLQPLFASVTIAEWRADPQNGQRYALVTAIEPPPSPQPWPDCPTVTPAQAKPWVLPAIAARLQGQQERFLAELRPAAALFLKFTGLDFDHDEGAPQKLDRYIHWVQSIINRQEGALIQLTTGDKGSYLYAAFGAPIAHDDDIHRAAAAASILRTPPPTCLFIATTQIGITYGTMRVGAYGSKSCKTYGVLGNETIMAARLMTHATPGQIVVSELIAETIRDQYQITALGHFKLKGKVEPQPLFALLQPHTLANRSQKLYETPLVGREAELQQLVDAARQVERGDGCMVRIEGSAGLGKSHLVATFAHLAKGRQMRPIIAGGQSTAQGTAYFAIRALLGTLLGLSEATTVESQIADLTAQLTQANPSWALRIPLLADLLALPIPNNVTTAAFDARLRQEALVTLTMEIIQHYAQQERLLLILEDIHWLDEASQGIVFALARSIPTFPLLLLLVHRPPLREQDSFLSEIATVAEQRFIALSELTGPAIVALVEQRLRGSITRLAASLIQIQAQGNPFFTEELVDALVESGQLQVQAGVWALVPTLIERLQSAGCLLRRKGEEMINPEASLSTVDLGIPSTIQGIILARLDRLPEPIKLTVKLASVIGRLFSHDLLLLAHPAAVVDTELDQEVATLLAREFARIEAPTPRRIYIFKHNITQEVVYQTLLSDQRHELHLGVATALERLQPESIEELALHYYNSNVELSPIREKALHYLEAAGLRAKHDYANETALNYFDRALGLEERAVWLQAKVEILHTLGRREAELAALDRLTSVTDADRGEVALLQGRYYEAMSDYDEAQKHLERALVHYKTATNMRGEVQSLNQLGVIQARQANYEVAKRIYSSALAIVSTEPTLQDEQAVLLYDLGIINRQQGRYPQAQHQLEEALSINQRMYQRQREGKTLTALGTVAYLQRDHNKAKQFYRAALDIAREIGERSGEAASLISLGQVARTLEDWGEVTQYILQGQTIFHMLGNQWWESRTLNELGVINLIIGDFVAATNFLQQSLTVSRQIGDSSNEAVALLNLGQVVREQGLLREAVDMHEQSMAIAQIQGDIDLEAQNWSDLAIVNLYLHQPEQAISYAQNSLKLLEKLGIEAALTTDLCTLAEASMQLNQQSHAETYTNQVFTLLEELNGEGADYPHRDYFTCYRILEQLGDHQRAHAALRKAYTILQKKAMRIGDPAMRSSFLENVTFNRQIMAIVTALEIAPQYA